MLQIYLIIEKRLRLCFLFSLIDHEIISQSWFNCVNKVNKHGAYITLAIY